MRPHLTHTEMNRLDLVRDLLQLSQPVSLLRARLAELDWDYQGDGVSLTQHHVKFVLTRYLSGELSSSDVELWANLVEGRDDICVASEDAAHLSDVLHELANPELTEPLNAARAGQLVDVLKSEHKRGQTR